MTPDLESPPTTRLRWSDEFDGDLSMWRQDDLVQSAEHRTGNKYIQPDGSVDMDKPWHKLPGRAAALYDLHREDCQFIRDGQLVMKGFAVNEPNPYRKNFTGAGGKLHPYGDWRLYDAWLSTNRETHTLVPGTVLEVRVNVEAQKMRGHRWNFWLMPVSGQAYDAKVAEVEIDCPEVENPSRVENTEFGSKALLKIVGGAAGDTPDGVVDLTEFGIDLRHGWHTFTTLWKTDGSLEFYVDKILCQSDDRHVTMDAYLIMAREMNSGVKDAPVNSWENAADGPKQPEDTGLTAQSVILDVDLMDSDEVLVDYVRVFDIVDDTEPKPEPKPEPVPDAAPKNNQEVDRLTALVEDQEQQIDRLTRAGADHKRQIKTLSDKIAKAHAAFATLNKL